MFCLTHIGMVGMSCATMSSAFWYPLIAVASSGALSACSIADNLRADYVRSAIA